MTPENNIIRLAQQQDYDGFYDNEIIIRRVMVYPPYCDMCSVLFVSENEIKALNASRDFLSKLKRTTAEEYRDVKIIVLVEQQYFKF